MMLSRDLTGPHRAVLDAITTDWQTVNAIRAKADVGETDWHGTAPNVRKIIGWLRDELEDVFIVSSSLGYKRAEFREEVLACADNLAYRAKTIGRRSKEMRDAALLLPSREGVTA